jgi:hypothetical protein
MDADESGMLYYQNSTEEEWWAEVDSFQTNERCARTHHHISPVPDDDPPAQAPQPLPPLEHTPGPALDASDW